MKKFSFSLREMTLVGVLAALVFAASMLQIMIPTPIDGTRIHLGNVMCLLSGLLLGPVGGGLAAGIGSMFFDFTNPIFIESAPYTLVFKFLMAFVCGIISWSGRAEARNTKRNIAAACCGATLYVILYLSKSFVFNVYFDRMEMATVMISISTKAVTSTINGIIAATVSVPLAKVVQRALKNTGVYQKQQ